MLQSLRIAVSTEPGEYDGPFSLRRATVSVRSEVKCLDPFIAGVPQSDQRNYVSIRFKGKCLGLAEGQVSRPVLYCRGPDVLFVGCQHYCSTALRRVPKSCTEVVLCLIVSHSVSTSVLFL